MEAMTTPAGAWTALITPFTADGSAIDTDRLTANVTAQGVAGMTGVVPCGTTGETPTLTKDEWTTVVSTTVRAAAPAGLRVMAGAGSYDTRTAMEQHRTAADLGVDAALHVCPYYNRPSQDGLRAHFEAIADAADIPVILYDIPGRTGVRLTMETIRHLADHPRIVGIKDATGDLATALRVTTETDLVLLSGDDPATLPLMSIGGGGVISVIGNLVPGRVARLVRLVAAGSLAEARDLHSALLPIARASLGLGPNPVPIKTALSLLGRDSGAVRLPLVPLGEDARASIRALLDTVAGMSTEDAGTLAETSAG